MNTALVSYFEGKPLATISYKGRPCWPAGQVGAALGYARDGLRFVNQITGRWAKELIEGQDFIKVEGEELKGLRTALGDDHTVSVSSSIDPKAARLLLLFESGVHLGALLTHKPTGVRLRRFLADEVLPQLVPGGAPDRAAIEQAVRAVLQEQLSLPLQAPAAAPQPLRPRILQLLNTYPRGLVARQLAELLGERHLAVGRQLGELVAEGAVWCSAGTGRASLLYRHPLHVAQDRRPAVAVDREELRERVRGLVEQRPEGTPITTLAVIEALGLAQERASEVRVGQVLGDLGYERVRRHEGGRRRYLYSKPAVH